MKEEKIFFFCKRLIEISLNIKIVYDVISS